MRARRQSLALVASLLVHLGLLAWVLTRPSSIPPRVTPAPPPAQTPLAWVDVDVPLPPQPTAPAAAPDTQRPPAAPKAAKRRARPAPAPTAAPAATPSGDDGAEQPLADSPRSAVLLPRPGPITSGPSAPSRGHTLRPGDLPSTEELLAEEEAVVAGRVDGFAHSATAAARVRGGLPAPLYGALGSGLREATTEVPAFIDTNSARDVGRAFAQSWLAGAQRYGATGSPYDEPPGRLERFEQPSALAEAASRGSPDAIALSQFFAAGARLQEFADGRAGAELYALVEVRQRGSGALESVTLMRPSGVLPFDRWVVDRAKDVAAGLTSDAGARDKPYRSLWRFDGIVTYRRELKASELNGRAALGMLSMLALSALSGLGSDPRTGGPASPRMPALSGNFDPVTGDVDVIDLTNPRYKCRVTLLEAD